MTPLHSAARQYAEAGWPVFPCVPDGIIDEKGKPSKAPFPGSRGFYEATTDLKQIDEWWTANPNANIGFCPGRAGLAVVDVDEYKGATWPEGAREVRTPSGGRHVYYCGSVAQSNGKIGPGIDTRGRTGYVLLPPSRVGGNGYVWKGKLWSPDMWDYELLPPDIAKRCDPTVREARLAAEGIEYDTPIQIQAAKAFLNANPLMDANDPATSDYITACRLLGIGLSDDMAVQLLIERGVDPNWAATEIAHAAQYMQNERGCDAPKSAAEVFEGLRSFAAASGAAGDHDRATAPTDSIFAVRDADELWDAEPITYWDEDHFLPKVPGGAVGVIYGKSGHHKTNVQLAMLFQTCLDHDIKVLYVAGEGTYGLRQARIPAHAKSRGLSREWVREHIGVVTAMPQLASDQLGEFIAVTKGWGAQIVVLDTLGTATAGIDENAKLMGDMLADNGAVGRIKRELGGVLVMVIGHSGKDAARGLRGSGTQYNNIDVELSVTKADNGKGVIVHCDKMRDGSDQLGDAFYLIKGDIPVPTHCKQGEFRDATNTTPEDQMSDYARLVCSILAEEQSYDYATGTPLLELVNLVRARCHSDEDADRAERAVRKAYGRGAKIEGGSGWAAALLEGHKAQGTLPNTPWEWRWRLPV